jgi:SAM-dependent methyltransferase
MDVLSRYLFVRDLPWRILRRLTGTTADYRAFLFEDLLRRLGDRQPRRILEIGPRDGEDTRRLLSLNAPSLVLVDLPNQKQRIEGWLKELAHPSIELVIGNVMYDRAFDAIEPFDVVWCTGVLYHNPEQLRFVRQLFDLTAPDGHLVLETATARLPATRNANCVEIWYPPDKARSGAYHVSTNVTHLPSAKAVRSWMEMIGFQDIERSSCHRRVARSLAAHRAAFIARRPVEHRPGTYYGHAGHDFPLGRTR